MFILPIPQCPRGINFIIPQNAQKSIKKKVQQRQQALVLFDQFEVIQTIEVYYMQGNERIAFDAVSV